MKALINVLLARAVHIQEEIDGLDVNTDVRSWDFGGLEHQAEELLRVIQAIETLREAQELSEEL